MGMGTVIPVFVLYAEKLSRRFLIFMMMDEKDHSNVVHGYKFNS